MNKDVNYIRSDVREVEEGLKFKFYTYKDINDYIFNINHKRMTITVSDKPIWGDGTFAITEQKHIPDTIEEYVKINPKYKNYKIIKINTF